MNGYALLPDIVWNWTLNGSPQLNEEGLLITILAGIAQTGSVAKVARDCGYSYRHIWGLIRTWEARFRQPLVDMSRGRGSSLAPLGLQLIRLDARLKSRFAAPLAAFAEETRCELAPFLSIGSSRLTLHASHDPLLARLPALLEEQNIGVDLHIMGSADSLASLAEGHCDIAGFHCPEGALGESVWETYRTSLDQETHILFRLAKRTQGLILASGNPKNIHTLKDLARPAIRFVNRQKGSGTRLLFDLLLSRENLSPGQLQGYEIEEFTHAAIAAMIASDAADAGMGVSAAAQRFGLDFVPLISEHYFLAIRRDRLDRPVVKDVLDFFSSPAWAQLLATEPGYEAADNGKQIECKAAWGDTKPTRKASSSTDHT